jgi:hypothetical protein
MSDEVEKRLKRLSKPPTEAVTPLSPEGAEGVKPKTKPKPKVPTVIEQVSKKAQERAIAKKPIKTPADVTKLVKAHSVDILPRKDAILTEIDAAIKKAPDKGKETIHFDIDGGLTVINTKDNLKKVRQAVAKLPKVERVGGKPRRFQLRDVPAKPGKKQRIAEIKKDLIHAPEGIVTDGRVIYKGDTPKGATFDEGRKPVSLETVQEFLDAKTKPATFQHYAVDDPTTGKGISARPIPIKGLEKTTGTGKPVIPKAVIKSGDTYYTYAQDTFAAMRKKFPDATLGVNAKSGNVIFTQAREPVAVVAPITLEKDSIGSKKPPVSMEDVFEADPTVTGGAKGEAGFAGIAGRPGGEVDKPWLDTEKIKSPDADMEAFFQRTKRFGAKKASNFLNKVKAAYVERFKVTPHIPDTPDTALARDIIRTMPEARRAAVEKAYEDYAVVLDGDGSTQVLSVDGLDLLAKKVFVEDFIVEADAGREVPGGFTVEQLQEEKVRLDDLLSKVPSVNRAYQARQALWQKVSQDLARREILTDEQAKNPHYVRHFVLQYMENEGKYMRGGKKKLKQPFRAYKFKRKGTFKDVSTDILEVDTHALAQIYADNAVEDAAQEIAERYGERPKFTQLAKDKNYENLVGGPKVVSRIEQIRGKMAEIRSQKPLDSGDKQQLKELSEELWELDPTMPFRARIAMFLSKLNKALGIDEVNPEDAEMWGGDSSISFAEMNAIIRDEPKSDAAMAARGAFKAMNERSAFIRATLGDDFITPEKLAESEDFVEWWYKRPNVWYRATTLDGSKLAQMLEAAAEEDVNITLPKAMLRQALVMGRRRQGWLIPRWLADQLDDLPANKRSGYVVDSLTKPFIQFMKRWYLRRET